MHDEKYMDKKINDIFPTNEIKNLMIQTLLGHGALLSLFVSKIIEDNLLSVPFSVQYAAASISYHLTCIFENLPNTPAIMCHDLNDIKEQDEETFLRKLKYILKVINDNLEKEE